MKPQHLEYQPQIEERIHNEILVDAYDPEEQLMSWYYYLQDTLVFPFKAKCIQIRSTSPLSLGEIVEVIDMSDEDDFFNEVFVIINWQGKALTIPLGQIEVIDGNDDTHQAVADWHYWFAQGYEL